MNNNWPNHTLEWMAGWRLSSRSNAHGPATTQSLGGLCARHFSPSLQHCWSVAPPHLIRLTDSLPVFDHLMVFGRMVCSLSSSCLPLL